MNKNVNYGNWVPEKNVGAVLCRCCRTRHCHLCDRTSAASCHSDMDPGHFWLRSAWSMAFTCISVMNCLPSAKAT